MPCPPATAGGNAVESPPSEDGFPRRYHRPMKKIAPTPLSDPFYYMKNLLQVVAWVRGHHADLLLPEEIWHLDAWLGLPRDASALLCRMVMRKGSLFRLSRLDYSEIAGRDAAVQALADSGWIRDDPPLELAGVDAVLTRGELFALAVAHAASGGVMRSMRRQALLAHLADSLDTTAARRLGEWLPGSDDRLIQLQHAPLLRRLQLMFFGNLRQDWSSFVTTVLGLHEYEPVAFTADSRAFDRREEVDACLQLAACREQLDAGVQPSVIRKQLDTLPCESDGVQRRRQRLLFAIARQAERLGDEALALSVYRDCDSDEASLRRLRIQLKRGEHAAVCDEAARLLRDGRHRHSHSLAGLAVRASKKLGRPLPEMPPRPDIPVEHWQLPRGVLPVEENLAAACRTRGEQAFYVENRLFPGLFALLCWDSLFMPIKGAFFNPFQAGPADLYHSEFVERRAGSLQDSLALLDGDDYRQRIVETLNSKAGRRCQLVHWPTLKPELILLVLARIPPADLRRIFQHMLEELRIRSSGFPDLIVFGPASGYRLVEVKGPGDSLQPQQRAWLEFFAASGIPASVAQVSWQP